MSYCGWDTDSVLHELWEKGKAKQDKKFYFFHSHSNNASIVTSEYLESEKKRLIPNEYKRIHEFRWTSSEEAFVEKEDLEACINPDLTPLLPNKAIAICIGSDASVKGDSTAICAVSREGNKIRLIAHRKWQS